MNTSQKNKQLDNALKVLDRWLDYQVYIRQIPGLSVGLVHNSKPLFQQGYGYADTAARRPATPDTCYRIASISKTFTAVAILQLVEKKQLRLTDAVKKYVPWMAKHSRVTIRHLLTHGSGLTRDGSTNHWEGSSFPDSEQFQQDAAQARIFRPGERFKYSNWGPSILGFVIEAVTGRTYVDYLQENIFDPLKLTHTSVDATRKTRPHLAQGYGRLLPRQGRAQLPYQASAAMAPAAGLISNAADLMRYMIALHPGNDELLSVATKRRMQQPVWHHPEPMTDYGLGLEVYQRHQQRYPGHGAGFNGYLGTMQLDVENKLGAVVLINALGVPVVQIMADMYHTVHYFLDGKHQRPDNERIANAERYEGRFTGLWEEVDVMAIDGKLWLLSPAQSKSMDNAMRLAPINKTTFRIMSGDPFDIIGETVTFGFDKKDSITNLKVGHHLLKPFQL